MAIPIRTPAMRTYNARLSSNQLAKWFMNFMLHSPSSDVNSCPIIEEFPAFHGT
jgi:hypothetical protein